MTLTCVVCWKLKFLTGPAETITDGHALCFEHAQAWLEWGGDMGQRTILGFIEARHIAIRNQPFGDRGNS